MGELLHNGRTSRPETELCPLRDQNADDEEHVEEECPDAADTDQFGVHIAPFENLKPLWGLFGLESQLVFSVTLGAVSFFSFLNVL